MEVEDQVVYRDAFLGKIQEKGRVLESIRFPLVATFFRPLESFSLSTFTEILQNVYCNHGSVNIVAQKQCKLMIMFSNDEDARAAYDELHGQILAGTAGPLVRFDIWHPMDDLGYDVADHHIYVSISGLPMHLWKEDVVEQILHPYCGLSYLSEETKIRRNLSSYTAFAWSQKRIAVPRRIALKVIKEISGDASLVDTEHYKEVSTYILTLDAVGFLCDAATECSCNLQGLNVRYEPMYDPDNAQCFLTEPPANKDLLDELNNVVIATTLHEHHGYQREEIQDMISDYLGCDMKVHRLNETQFIILSSDESTREVTKEILLQKKSFSLSLTTFNLDHWKNNNMSVIERLPVKIKITLNEIPAHLCTPKIVRFVLSPYCAPKIDKDHQGTVISSERFSCTAWTNSERKIPMRIMAALFVQDPGCQDLPDGYCSTDLRITQLITETTVL